MPRPRSEDRQDAILSAAARVIASRGLGATTAAIAKEAGVSNGSLFLYFDTKAALVNELYVALKTEMAAAAVEGLPAGAGRREQLLHMWNQWLRWATAYPEKRRALAQLDPSEDITAESHRTASRAFSGIAELLERSRADGPMKDVPLGFVLALTTAIAEATIDAMIREPTVASAHSRTGFDAVWRVLASSPLPATA
jgi:AcrR family transcriptional regulator